MIAYSKTLDPSKCCGCRACDAVCPVNAISMAPDDEGFLYPILNTSECISCGICAKVCPVENRPEGNSPINVYAARINNLNILQKSSSGGMFRLLADKILQDRGMVAGCIFDSNKNAYITVTSSRRGIDKMMGSKYVYSDMSEVFSVIKKVLDNGKKVLFTGAPCQCAAIINFLKKPYDNLFIADFICHGMPSSKILGSYVDILEKRYGRIRNLSFRDKKKRGWGMNLSFEDKRGKKHYKAGNTDPYIYGYTNGWFNRYACYECNFRGDKRYTDFTFCDYWGVKNYHNIPDVYRGVSVLAVNSVRGVELLESIRDRVTLIETDPSNAAIQNPSLLYEEREIVPEIRKTIYKDIEKYGFEKISKTVLKCPKYTLKLIAYKIPSSLVRKVKNMLGR